MAKHIVPGMYGQHFWAGVRKGGPNECWEWTRSRKDRHGKPGYGNATSANSRRIAAHRFAWILTNGPIPTGGCVCHSCDNPPCCNPAHLFLGTMADNVADMIDKGRKMVVRGEGHGMCKLTEEQAKSVIAAANAGEAQRAIARRLGIRQSHVWRIIHGESWKYLPR